MKAHRLIFCAMSAVLGLNIAFGTAAVVTISADVTAPGDPVVGVSATSGSNTSTLATSGFAGGANNYPSSESPPNAIDNNSSTKYLNFAKTGVGIIVTAQTNGPLTTINGLRMAAANDAPDRDPITITLEGSTDANSTSTLNSTWTTIYSET